MHKSVRDLDIVRTADQKNVHAIPLNQQVDQRREMLLRPLLRDVARTRVNRHHRLGEQLTHRLRQFLQPHGRRTRLHQQTIILPRMADRIHQGHQVVNDVAPLALKLAVTIPVQRDVQERKLAEMVEPGQNNAPRCTSAQSRVAGCLRRSTARSNRHGRSRSASAA